MAAFAQVQSLTETLNDYIKITQQQEISAVSTLLCDECYSKSQDQEKQQPLQQTRTDRSSASSQSSTATTVIKNTTNTSNDQIDCIQDDDGYCEIDEIRLPAIIKSTGLPSSPSSSSSNPELKRQGTINADSIPEETEQDMNSEKAANTNFIDDHDNIDVSADGNDKNYKVSNVTNQSSVDQQQQTSGGNSSNIENDIDEHTEVQYAYDSISQPLSELCNDSESIAEEKNFCMSETCGANRLVHTQAVAPSVPCHLISNYVSALNLQISQLLVSY